MNDRESLIELVKDARDAELHFCSSCFDSDECLATGYCDKSLKVEADHLIANGVTVKSTTVPYNRLLELAKKMHCWIFLYVGDEREVYDELGLTDEENYVFGYGSSFEVSIPNPKEAT